MLIQTPTGKNIILDAGYADQCTRKVIPYLNSIGVTKIDVMVLSHTHADHYEGLYEIAKIMPVGQFICSSQPGASTLKNYLSSKGVPRVYPKRGDTYDWGGGVYAHVLSTYDPTWIADSGTNNNSVVIKLEYGKNSFLLTGDIEAAGEAALVSHGIDIKADVLKSPHHGGVWSSHFDFLMAVDPAIAVIQCGHGEEWPMTAEKHRAMGTTLYRNDQHGIIVITSDGTNLSTTTTLTTTTPYIPNYQPSLKNFTGTEATYWDDLQTKRELLTTWLNGKVNGRWEYFFTDGVRHRGDFNYINGVRDGPGYIYYGSRLWSKNTAYNEKLIGTAEIYYNLTGSPVWKRMTYDSVGNLLKVQKFASDGTVTYSKDYGTGTTTVIPPAIKTQPLSVTVTAGQTATFIASASGSPAPTYQWTKNGVAITGATAASYTTPATTLSDSGAIFKVIAKNSGGSVTSAGATLTVNAATVAPSISSQPANKTVTAGQTATFSVTATGSPAPTYQWTKNDIAISGATSSSYTTPATALGDNGAIFKVLVKNSAGSVTSTGATLTVNAAAVAPSITTQPASKSVTAGQTASFSVVATGSPSPTYQWKKNGADISGATSATYTTPATVSSDNNSLFSVVVKNSAGSVTSQSATLTVTNPVTTTISVTSYTLINADNETDIRELKNGDILNAATLPTHLSIRANVSSGVGSVTMNLSGPLAISRTENAAPYALFTNTSTSYDGAVFPVGSYTLKSIPYTLDSAGGMAGTALTVNFSVVNNVTPSITTQPSSASAIVGQTVTFTASATGTPAPSYQWKKNGVAITGATSSSYTTPALAMTDNNAQFTVTASNSAGSVTSSGATLSVYPFKIVSYTLINADSNTAIRDIIPGEAISQASLPTKNLNIRANLQGSGVGSVKFVLTGAMSTTHMENGAPYALFSNTNTDYFGKQFPAGSYALTGFPYSADNGGGSAGMPLTITFSMTN